MIYRKIIILGFLAAIFLAAGCDNKQGYKEKYLEKAKIYLQENNNKKARIELKNAIQIDPKYTDALLVFADLEERNKNFREALGYYTKALESSPENIQANLKIATFYLRSGSIKKAELHLQKILKLNPALKEARLLKSAILLSKRELDDALVEVSSLVDKYPGFIDAIILKSTVYIEKKDRKSAISVLEEGISSNNDNAPLRLNLAQIYTNTRLLNKAEKLLLEVVELNKGNSEYQTALVTFYIATRQPEKAEKLLRNIIHSSPGNVVSYLNLVDFLFSEKRFDDAENELRTAIQLNPDLMELRFSLADLLLYSGDEEGSIRVYKDIIDVDNLSPNSLRAKNKLAQIMLNNNKLKEASNIVDSILSENVNDSDALILKGKLFLFDNDFVSAINVFRPILKDRPELFDVAKLLATAHVRNNEKYLAVDVLEQSINANSSNPRAYTNYAEFFIDLKEYDRADNILLKLERFSPNNLDLLKVKLRLLSARNNNSQYFEVFNKIQEYYPDVPLGYQLLGDYYIKIKEYDKAINQFEMALEKSPDSYEAFSGMLKVFFIQKKYKEAENKILKLISDNKSHKSAYGLLGELYMQQENYADAKSAFIKSIKISPEWAVPYGNLGSIYMRDGDIDKAINVFGNGLKMNPDNNDLKFSLAKAYELSGKFNDAITQYQHIVDTNTSNRQLFFTVINNLSLLLIDTVGTQDSYKKVDDLLINYSTNKTLYYMDIKAWMAYKSGDLVKALNILTDLLAAEPDNYLFNYHLGMVLYKQGKTVLARKHLESAAQSKTFYSGINEARKLLKVLN